MKSLAQLAHGIQRCHKCRLHQNRLHAVAGEGSTSATVVFIGEAPGKMEDQLGLPFQGAAGRFLREMLATQQWPRECVFFTNCVKCRPPNNRKPRNDELRTCATQWLLPQLEILNPQLVVLMGEVAVQTLLDLHQPLNLIHGVMQQQNNIHYLPTYHPASAMRFPGNRRAMEEDLIKALEAVS